MPNSDCKLFYPSLYLLEFLRINIDENIGRPMLPSIPNENAYLNRVVKPIYDLCVEVEGSIMGTTISIEKNNGLLQGEERKHERSESLSLLQDRGLASGFLGVCSPESADLRRPTGIKRPCECTIAHDISLENVSRMHELSEAFHAISLRHTCLLSILEQFSKLSSRAGDLSFNKLNGEIPNLDGLTNVEVMCLTGNRLNGNIPDGIKGRNLFRSFSEEGNLELGGCLENYPCKKDGNYTVKIHFAEIIIRGNKSFHSLGRQIFNVYIQGKLESEDFDVVQAAQGVEKVVVKEFKAVVKNKTLETHFHWAGKGTTAIPSRGTCGPLISAISVESGEFRPYSFLVKYRSFSLS
ncbi:hypothetical protein VitviT2T_014072 [Vitis vinifera]|uniref:Malectin domain-containing protein n=1 Tax=Vitis vinifera TaxID=29760 RepID=A0ABY9CIL4_VITVI|nr:hypothetical protein VitviT2T_014072 [Vitis vinifera]